MASQIVSSDKTLVAWVQISNLDANGGSVITIGQETEFDGIVYGEKSPRGWMAGSDFGKRSSLQNQQKESEIDPNKWIQMALVHEGTRATLYRNGVVLDTWLMSDTAPSYGETAYVYFGLRHAGAPDPACFEGNIADARIYSKSLTVDDLNKLVPHKILQDRYAPAAWWDFSSGMEDKMGAFAFHNGSATIQDGHLVVSKGKYALFCYSHPPLNTITFRPTVGSFADPNPFFWAGSYHVFYEQGGVGHVPWEHITSSDLVHWKELPPALISNGQFDSWDGGQMATGSIIEDKGKFYAVYAGQNFEHPVRREVIRLAESDDLVHWVKHPEFLLKPDGQVYSDKKLSDFRDPFVFKQPDSDEWQMLLCADQADGKGVTGLYVSKDLWNWKPRPPVGPFQECPDFFKIGNVSYLLGGAFYSSKKDGDKDYIRPAQSLIDSPAVYAGKSMFDGRRHVWVGWLADRADNKDAGPLIWGGFMCTPRELVAAPNGELYVRPVQEVVDAFSKTVRTLKDIESCFPPNQWVVTPNDIESKDPEAKAFFPVPDCGMAEVRMTLSPNAIMTLVFRSQSNDDNKAYDFTVDASASRVTTRGQGVEWKREGCVIDTSKPITIRTILGNGTVEVFIDNKYAFSRRAHELASGQMGLMIRQGNIRVSDFSFKELF